MKQVHVVELLGSALESVDGNAGRRKRVERAKRFALSALIAELSLIERETSDATLVRLIATAKQVLTGRRSPEEFIELCDKVTGMV